MPLLIGLTLLILIEVSLYVTLGAAIGLAATLLVVLGTLAWGALVVRAQGRHAVGRVVEALLAGRNPLTAAGHGALLALAGILLILPGFLTDALGMALLVPALRRLILRRLAGAAQRQAAARAMAAMVNRATQPGQGPRVAPDVEEAETLENPEGHGDSPSGWTRPEGPHARH